RGERTFLIRFIIKSRSFQKQVSLHELHELTIACSPIQHSTSITVQTSNITIQLQHLQVVKRHLFERDRRQLLYEPAKSIVIFSYAVGLFQSAKLRTYTRFIFRGCKLFYESLLELYKGRYSFAR